MKNIFVTVTLVSVIAASSAHAQTADSKSEWAAKVVAAQQGPELDRLVAQLTESAVQELIANWGPKIDSNVPAIKRTKATEEMNAELKQYAEDTQKVISGKVGPVSSDAMIAAYAERFTLEELKQIATFFESAAIKKYQTQAPELGSLFVQKLLEASRPEVAARAEKFNETATKIVGTTPVAPAATRKSPAKK